MVGGEKNGWEEWSKYVLKELERLNEAEEHIKKDISKIKISLATLETEMKLKAGIWGTIGAAIPITILLVTRLLLE